MSKPVPQDPQAPRRPGAWIVFFFLLAIALFMYVSIMVKIIKFGP